MNLQLKPVGPDLTALKERRPDLRSGAGLAPSDEIYLEAPLKFRSPYVMFNLKNTCFVHLR